MINHNNIIKNIELDFDRFLNANILDEKLLNQRDILKGIS